MPDTPVPQASDRPTEPEGPTRCDRTVPSACERCGGPVLAEHGHFKCRACGWLTHCCEGGSS